MIKELTKENTSLLDGWKTMKLVDVCIVERGSSPRPIKKFVTDDEDGVNWIKIGDTKNIEKYIYKTNQKITKEGAEKSRFVEEGDFILSNSMSFGKPYIMKTQGYIHDGWFKLKLHDFVDSEYFYQLLSSPLVNDQFHNLASGSVVKNISGDLVKKVVLPIPPLLQQKQIVAILDKAFAAIDTAKANAEQNLQNAKELFESISLQKFTDGINIKKWKLEKIEKYSQVVVGYVGPISKEYTNDENDVLLLSTKNISDVGVSLKKLTRINHTFHNKQKKSQLLPGDILVARHGKSGQAAVIPDSMKAAHALNVIIIKRSETILSEYIAFLLNSGVLSKIQDSKGGSVQEIINTSVIKNLIIPVPNVQHQGKIIEELNNVSKQAKKLEAIYTQKIADLEEMKKSVLQKAFSGQLNTLN